jgi:multidrug resistance efflux pump
VEPVFAQVITTVPGTIESIAVERFQPVKKGDPIAILSVAETNFVSAEMQAVLSEVQVMRARLDMDRLRASQVYERERLAILEQRVQLETDRVNLKLEEAKFRIQEDLFTNMVAGDGKLMQNPLISTNDYYVALYTWEALQVRVKETEAYLKVREDTLPKLMAENTNTMTAIEGDIRAQLNRVAAATTNLILRAPMDGVVSVISNRPGERVMAGTPIAMVTGTHADRIIAYMRQPITTMPKPGDTLQVRRRTFMRQMITATVRDVGTQLEPISPTLLAGATTIDLGLPFAINLPEQFDLVPGEIVDVIYNEKR